jgi:hypothetical protein
MPLFFFTDGIKKLEIPTPDIKIQELLNTYQKPPPYPVYLYSADLESLLVHPRNATVFIPARVIQSDSSPTQVHLKLETAKSGFLVQLENHDPGWTAEVDGKKNKIFRADYAYQAIPVQAGVHDIVLRYRAHYIEVFWLHQLASLVLITAILLSQKKVIRGRRQI